ncbi:MULTISPECIES: bestrophin family protein [Elizabethkingia]|uniref:Multidrug transporter n=1 Tax=Elizabethkingia anophelis TaxID=1117645 RepID=A0AAE4P4N9_9FLAO|nr:MULTISPECIES: bestrophin family ion channel [Elizabethkingia]AQW89148.1 multidrug transporter [Elizabethkingia anophelis]AQW95801.1 multidrug transporter [Elizabethkingia anophelis]AQX02872.1 multidrug transporter [Elizabethkingia anophelis]EJC8060457.1 multidrug transporter [Elizabethkingia anophelis]KFC33539.1 multidrug transporter [Elizabethkingia anophelis]
MHTGKRYTPFEFAKWTKRDTLLMLLIATVPTILYVIGWKFIGLPWQPVAILGTAVAFIVGFKNNASYNRIWEARQIYGAIINDSRSFAYSVRDTLGGKESSVVKRIFYRHFAWLTALRFQLREPRSWENMNQRSNSAYRKSRYEIPELNSTLEEELKQYLSGEELEYILSKKNKATQLTALQSEEFGELKKAGDINDFQWTLLQQSIIKFTDDQGKAERIKNFPYPRNFASIATYLLFIFVILAPFGLVKEMDKLGEGTFLQGYTVWFNIPFSAIIAWAFHTLDTVGESSVNPFEGSANDIPITQISRTIEIDMRDMLDEKDLPQPITPKNNIVL